MPREVITIQVGQCGNQIGCRFWDLVLREHAHVQRGMLFDAALSSFFRNVDTRYANPVNIPVGDGGGLIRALKARAILVDMEEGVVNSLLAGPLAELFDTRQCITDVSGSGNNWAHGHHCYGPQYRDSIEEKIRKEVENCDSLQCFFLLHSLGGGTGSGFGTFLLETLADNYKDAFRFNVCVCPSKDDDVITSPYNATLALKVLIESAHCVLPVSNDALVSICNQISSRGSSDTMQGTLIDLPQDERRRGSAGRSSTGGNKPSQPSLSRQESRISQDIRLPPSARRAGPQRSGREVERGVAMRKGAHSEPPGRRSVASPAVDPPPKTAVCEMPIPQTQRGVSVNLKGEKPFDRMNSLIAHLLNNLTSSMRFEGSLNLDLNEITTNLVPFPRMHFLLPSMSPLYFGKDPKLIVRGFPQTFSDVLTPQYQLMNVDPRDRTYMALAFLVRGSASISDVTQNIARVRKHIKMLPCNEDAFKIGLCGVPPKGLPYSVLALGNSCATHHMLGHSLRDFSRLYTRRAHVHHYTQYMDLGVFDEAYETVNSLMKDYLHLDIMQEAPPSCLGPPTDPVGAFSLLFSPSAKTYNSAMNDLRVGGSRHFATQPLI